MEKFKLHKVYGFSYFIILFLLLIAIDISLITLFCIFKESGFIISGIVMIVLTIFFTLGQLVRFRMFYMQKGQHIEVEITEKSNVGFMLGQTKIKNKIKKVRIEFIMQNMLFHFTCKSGSHVICFINEEDINIKGDDETKVALYK